MIWVADSWIAGSSSRGEGPPVNLRHPSESNAIEEVIAPNLLGPTHGASLHRPGTRATE